MNEISLISPEKNALWQDTELEFLESILQFVETNSFIDVGAEKGVFSERLLGCGFEGVAIEPMKGHCNQLGVLAGRYPGLKILQYAVADCDGEREFFIATGPNGEELDFYHSLTRARAPGKFEHNNSITVECRSLESLCEEGALPSSVGVLKIDTEGNDLSVIKGLGALRPAVVISEYFTEGIYEGWDDADPAVIVREMTRLGYRHFLMFKRLDNIELAAVDTLTWHERQWGNIFFFSDTLFENCSHAITDILRHVESGLTAKVRTLTEELQKKEEQIGILAKTNKDRLNVIEVLDTEVKRLHHENKRLKLKE